MFSAARHTLYPNAMVACDYRMCQLLSPPHCRLACMPLPCASTCTARPHTCMWWGHAAGAAAPALPPHMHVVHGHGCLHTRMSRWPCHGPASADTPLNLAGLGTDMASRMQRDELWTSLHAVCVWTACAEVWQAAAENRSGHRVIG
jgi:hypothetical protein